MPLKFCGILTHHISIDYHYQLLVGEFPCRAFEQANGQDLPVRIYGLHIMEFNVSWDEFSMLIGFEEMMFAKYQRTGPEILITPFQGNDGTEDLVEYLYTQGFAGGCFHFPS